VLPAEREEGIRNVHGGGLSVVVVVNSEAPLAKPAVARSVGLVNAVIHKFTNRFGAQL
jgi:hypothetical protein